MILPDVTLEILEELANGKVCPECDDGWKMIATLKERLPLKCPKCQGTGRLEPDLRMIDAMVLKTRRSNIKIFKNDSVWSYGINGDENILPYYTTDWAAGGPLLEKICKGKVIPQIYYDAKKSEWWVDVFDGNYKWFDFHHPSELVARVGAWLLWKDATK